MAKICIILHVIRKPSSTIVLSSSFKIFLVLNNLFSSLSFLKNLPVSRHSLGYKSRAIMALVYIDRFFSCRSARQKDIYIYIFCVFLHFSRSKIRLFRFRIAVNAIIFFFFFFSSFGINRGAASQRKRLFPGNEAAGQIIITT